MKCPKCGGPMVQLFIDWVCDRCQPAQPQAPTVHPAGDDYDDYDGYGGSHAEAFKKVSQASNITLNGIPVKPGSHSLQPKPLSSFTVGGHLAGGPAPTVTHALSDNHISEMFMALAGDTNMSANQLRTLVETFMDQVPSVIAGGALRDSLRHTQINDLDLFVPAPYWSEASAQELIRVFGVTTPAKTDDFHLRRVYAVRVGRLSIQMVRTGYLTLTEIVTDFDFTCCAAAISRSVPATSTSQRVRDWHRYAHPSFEADATRGQLVPLNKSNVSVKRIVRLMNRGWKFDEKDLDLFDDRLPGKLNRVITGGY